MCPYLGSSCYFVQFVTCSLFHARPRTNGGERCKDTLICIRTHTQMKSVERDKRNYSMTAIHSLNMYSQKLTLLEISLGAECIKMKLILILGS